MFVSSRPCAKALYSLSQLKVLSLSSISLNRYLMLTYHYSFNRRKVCLCESDGRALGESERECVFARA